MAVAVIMNFTGGTPEQYDQTLAKMEEGTQGPPPPGSSCRLVTKADDGLMVIEVWNSQETFENYFDEKFGPAAYEVGVPRFPDIAFHDVHHYLSGSSASTEELPP